MRKRFLCMMLVLTVMFGTCSIALAADTRGAATGSGLKSYGKIVYQNGGDKVEIDSGDLYMLADQLDLFKRGITEQLNSMNTYFTTGAEISLSTDADIYVTHTRPSDEDSVDPLSINFDTLLEGVAASQSVSSNVTAYGYPEGTQLYKNADGSLTTDGSGEGAEQISVTAASPDNLSAGTAAWVDGRLILGTGEDNKSCRDDGYKKGLDDGGTGSQKHMTDIIANGNPYVVPENISGAILYIAYPSLRYDGTFDGPSFSTPDGSAVSDVLFWSKACNYGADHAHDYHYCGAMWYIPKLKADTVITVPNGSSASYLFYFTA